MKRARRLAIFATVGVTVAGVAWFVDAQTPHLALVGSLRADIRERSTEIVMFNGQPAISERIALQANVSKVEDAIAKSLPELDPQLLLGMTAPTLEYFSARPDAPIQRLRLSCGRVLPVNQAFSKDAEGWVTVWITYRPTTYAQILNWYRTTTHVRPPRAYFVGDETVKRKDFDLLKSS